PIPRSAPGPVRTAPRRAHWPSVSDPSSSFAKQLTDSSRTSPATPASLPVAEYSSITYLVCSSTEAEPLSTLTGPAGQCGAGASIGAYLQAGRSMVKLRKAAGTSLGSRVSGGLVPADWPGCGVAPRCGPVARAAVPATAT